ncbi:MAG: tRNA (adenosine(37)-N6)-threonylcarbamoyltransferase complex transferase subunit TsaD [bacterium]|nr:tRNA (adenosine(37)-N6)-threonylcarbamoyltransferase complex transferase subunit TsaD [bacterium]
MSKILAIETSCDETAAAVVEGKEENGKSRLSILVNVVSSQIELHKKFGGVYPEVASRAHAEKIIPVIEEALEKSETQSASRRTNVKFNLKDAMKEIDAIAVTYGPGLIGSLAVGLAAAKTLAYCFDKPIIPVHHWEGHIYSNFIREKAKSKKQKVKIPGFPSLILTVSGGHTSLILMKDHGKYEILGQTLDDAAGEAFDKVARLLGLPYPGGPSISAEADKIKYQIVNSKIKERCTQEFNLPRPMINSKDLNFSFSGLKTAVLYKIKALDKLDEKHKAALAAEFQDAITDTLVSKTIQAAKKYHPKSICLTGGVAANKMLREKFLDIEKYLEYQPDIYIPAAELTTDNATMIGAAGYYHLLLGKTSKWYDINVASNATLNSKE